MAVYKNGAASGVFGELGWPDTSGAQLGARCALLTPSYDYDTTKPTTHLTWGQVKASEIALGGGYTVSGGIAVPTRTIQSIDADKTAWANGGQIDFGTIPTGRQIRFALYIESTVDAARVWGIKDLRPFNGGQDIIGDGGTLVLNHIDGHIFGYMWT
ncbi:MAG: hypothetical protein H6832_14950 [Planctomycetes bacterium]|nr:hypothetical protein [Planctomycetota bacterium]